jgi:hypothetical protein
MSLAEEFDAHCFKPACIGFGRIFSGRSVHSLGKRTMPLLLPLGSKTSEREHKCNLPSIFLPCGHWDENYIKAAGALELPALDWRLFFPGRPETVPTEFQSLFTR